MRNVEDEVNRLIEFVRDYYNTHNLKGAVLGISGGKDSAVVAAILVKALGKENVIGFTLPCHSKEEDSLDAKLVSDYFGFKLYDFDLSNVFDNFKESAIKIFPEADKDDYINSDINLKPRLRMASLYYFAALLSSIKNKIYLVAGTSNKSEIFVGYYTKGADNVHDIATIADFTVDEVIAIGEYLNVPEKVLYKTPSDGLSDMTDEDRLGVTYKEIEEYMKDPSRIDSEVKRNKISKMHEQSKHKLEIPTYKKKRDE